MTVGGTFNPSRTVCGFYPPDVYAASREDGDGPKRLYERLVRWAGTKGECWHTYGAMADALGKCKRRVIADMQILIDRGLIQAESRGKKGGGRGSNVYRFLWHPMFAKVTDVAPLGSDAKVTNLAPLVVGKGDKYAPPKVTNPALLKVTNPARDKNYVTENYVNGVEHSRSPSVSKSANAIDSWFTEEFWPAYPRKVGKSAALRIARKVAKSAKDIEAIMEGLTRQLPGLQAKELQFVPHCSTWLNQRRWEDEPEAEPEAEPRPAKRWLNPVERLYATEEQAEEAAQMIARTGRR